MGFFTSLFSFRDRKKNTIELSSQSVKESPHVAPAPKWRHSIENLSIITHPLDLAPGTDLERSFIYSVLISLLGEIALQEKPDLQSLHFALAEDFRAKGASEGLLIQSFPIVGISYDPQLGYSARLSAMAKKFTVLLGAPAPVSRASTPFHHEINSLISLIKESLLGNDQDASSVKREMKVLAIDGIAYAAFISISIFE